MDGKLAIFMGRKGLFEYAGQKQGPWLCNLLIVDADLKTIHDEEMDLMADGLLAQTAADRFVLVGRPLTSGVKLVEGPQETLVRQYDVAGHLKHAIHCPFASRPFYPRVAASQTQLFFAIADWQERRETKRKISLNCISLSEQ